MPRNHVTHGQTGTRLYRIWKNMVTRCYNKHDPHYRRWGGLGVKMCREWRCDFKVFHDWAMSNGYSDDLQIDRIDNDGNYEPDNCRWVTAITQTRNRKWCLSPTDVFEIRRLVDDGTLVVGLHKKGKSLTVAELSRRLGASHNAVTRVAKGLTYREVNNHA